jgi:predicted AlkP superfamily phosphohydrolase/phosphomutase
MPGPKVCVIGLDGTPASYLRREIAAGRLPAIGALARAGSLIPARAPLPPISSVSWASASTGTNPGRHGVYGFVERRPGTWDITFTNSLTIREPAVWALAGTAGMRSVVVNIPGTYPAQPQDEGGVLISGFVSPTLEKSVQPPALLPFLRERDYLIDVDLSLGHRDLDAFMEQMFTHHEARTRVLVDLLEGERCDLFYVAFTGTDRLHHFLWEQMERGEEPWATRFLEYYAAVDASVGELARRVPDDCLLLLLSDHGFCRLEQEVFVNRWLERDGWLALSDPALSIASVIPERSRAYCMDPGRLYVNLEGREPGGLVTRDEYDAVRDELKAWAEALPFVARVATREEAFHGPAAHAAPDLVLVSRNGYDLKGSVRSTELEGRGRLTGMHTQDDAFVLLRDGASTAGPADVHDVAATVLDGLGLDPSGLDGRVLT